MAEYIERGATCKDCFYDRVCPHTFDYDANRCGAYINKADVVEVVRCKDCKYWGGVIFGYICRRFSGTTIRNETRENDYCSFGERKGGADNG